MLMKNLLRGAQRTSTMALRKPVLTSRMPQVVVMPMNRSYYPDNVLMPREYGDGYYSDPVETAERIVRLLALHDNINDPSSITTGQTFEEIGLNELDMCEVYLMLEKDFDFEISEDDCESFKTVNDLVEHVARSFYAK